jgi:hypothetical protein
MGGEEAPPLPPPQLRGFHGREFRFVSDSVAVFVDGNGLHFVSLDPDAGEGESRYFGNPHGRAISAIAVSRHEVRLPRSKTGPAALLRPQRNESSGSHETLGEDADDEERLVAFASHDAGSRIIVVAYPSLATVATFEVEGSLPYHALAFSEDGLRLASISTRPEFTLHIWDIEEESMVAKRVLAQDLDPRTLPAHDEKLQLSFCPVVPNAVCVSSSQLAVLLTYEYRAGSSLNALTLHHFDAHNNLRGFVAHVWGPPTAVTAVGPATHGARGATGAEPETPRTRAIREPETPRTRAIRVSPETSRTLWLITSAGEAFGAPVAQYNLRGTFDGEVIRESAFFDIPGLRGRGVSDAPESFVEGTPVPIACSDGTVAWIQWAVPPGGSISDGRWTHLRDSKVDGTPNCIEQSRRFVATGCSTGTLISMSKSGEQMQTHLSGHGNTDVASICSTARSRESGAGRFVACDVSGRVSLWSSQGERELAMTDFGGPDGSILCSASVMGAPAFVVGRSSGRVQVISTAQDRLAVVSSCLAFRAPVSAVAVDDEGEIVVAATGGEPMTENDADDPVKTSCVVVLRATLAEETKGAPPVLALIPVAFVSLKGYDQNPLWLSVSGTDDGVDVIAAVGDALVRFTAPIKPLEGDDVAPIRTLPKLPHSGVQIMQGGILAASVDRSGDDSAISKSVCVSCRASNGAFAIGTVEIATPSESTSIVPDNAMPLSPGDPMKPFSAMSSNHVGQCAGISLDGRVTVFSPNYPESSFVFDQLAWTMRSEHCAVAVSDDVDKGSILVVAALGGVLWSRSIPVSEETLRLPSSEFARRLQDFLISFSHEMQDPEIDATDAVFESLVAQQQEAERLKHRKQHDAHLTAVKPIADQVRVLVEANSKASKLENLPPDELVVDVRELEHQRDEVRKQVGHDQDDLKEQCVRKGRHAKQLHGEMMTSMETQYRAVLPFEDESIAPVGGFGVRRPTEDFRLLMSKMMNMRRIELAAQKRDGYTPPRFNNDFPTTFAGSLREQALKGEASVKGPESKDEGDAEEEADEEEDDPSIRGLLYHPFDVCTPLRRTTQSFILRLRAQEIADEFNQRVDQTLEKKSRYVDAIDDKIDRIEEIMLEVEALEAAQAAHADLVIQGAPADKEKEEKSSAAASVASSDDEDYASEVSSMAEMSVPERPALAGIEDPDTQVVVTQAELDAIAAEFSESVARDDNADDVEGDPVSRMREMRARAGLRTMMGAVGGPGSGAFGSVAASGLGIDSIPPAPAGWGLPEDDIDDAMRKANKNFQQRLDDMFEQREKNLKALETELKKLTTQIHESQREFDEELGVLGKERMSVQLRLLQHFLLRATIIGRLTETEHDGQVLQQLAKQHDDLIERTQHGSVLLSAQTKELEQLRRLQEEELAQDRLADKNARREIDRDFREHSEALWKYYRHRSGGGRPHSGRSQTSAHTSASRKTGELLSSLPAFEEDTAAQAVLARYPEVTVDMLMAVRELKVIKLETEKRIHKRAAAIRELKILHEHLLSSEKVAHDELSAVLTEFSERWEKKVRRDRDADILLSLRQGQVEVDDGDDLQRVVTSFAESSFIPESEVEQCNVIVRSLGEERLGLLKDLSKAKQAIRRQQWENERLDMISEDWIEKTKYFQLLRLTKALQETIKDVSSDSTGTLHNAEIRRLEARQQRSADVHLTQVAERKRHIKRFRQQAREKELENDRLQHSLVQLREAVAQRQVVYDSAHKGALIKTQGKGANRAVSGASRSLSLRAKESTKKLTAARRLNEIIKSQDEEIAQLQRDLARRRQKAFPFLSERDANRTDVSFVQWEQGGDTPEGSARGVDPGATGLSTIDFGATPMSSQGPTPRD